MYIKYYIKYDTYIVLYIIESERVRGEKGDEGDEGSNRATEQPAAQPAVHVSREGRDECRQAGREGKRQAGPQSE